jgi:ATP/maltotriose-dependent transcriptional regulator MalT
LSFEQGQLTAADATIRQATEGFHTQKMADDEIIGRAMLARVLVAEGQGANARVDIESASQLAAKSQDRDAQLALTIAKAIVFAAEGRGEEAAKVLAGKLRDTGGRARLDLRYEARLELGAIEMKSGKTASGRGHLDVLQKDATSKGFRLIAQKAAKERG